MHHHKKGKLVISIIAMISLVAITSNFCNSYHHVDASYTASASGLQPVSLTLVALNGTEVVLNEVDIGNLPSYRAYGGYKNQYGIIKGLGNYTGVNVTALCNRVGDINSNNIVRITASDNYTMDFNYTQIHDGAFDTFNPTPPGDSVPHNQPLVPIIAYYKNDQNLTTGEGGEGPLRLAIVGPEGLVTNSTLWVKYVAKLEILDASVPEFPNLLVAPVLMISTLLAVMICKRKEQKLTKLW